MLRLVRPDAKKFVLPSLTWDPMTSALLEACQEILNYPIMTAMENPLKSTMDLGNPRLRTTRSLHLPSLSSQQQPNALTFMQGHYFLSVSCSSMLYIGLYIYDKNFHLYEIQYHFIVTNAIHNCWSVKALHCHSNILHSGCYLIIIKYSTLLLNGSMIL